MKLILHLFKFNLKFHKVRILFLSFISLAIVILCHKFIGDSVDRGQSIIQYSLYIMFMIFTMRMNSKSTLSLGVKHLQALPMSNREIVFSQSIADITFYIPISFVTLYGIYLVKPEYHIGLVAIIFHIMLVAANIISFNKKIDLGRMQHTKASIKNSFVYLKKYVDTIIQITIMSLLVMVLAISFESNIFLQEYSFLILVIIFTFVLFSRTVKMLKDETLSYFLFKRDIKTMGLKLSMIGVPVLAVLMLAEHGDKKLMRSIAGTSKEVKYVDRLSDKMKDLSYKVDERKLILDISINNEKGIQVYLDTHKELPADIEVLGNYLSHISAESGNIKILKELYKQDPLILNQPGKHKKISPLQAAMRGCKLKTAEYLLSHGANINHQDLSGESAIVTAARSNCFGGVILLSEYGANLDLKNKDGKSLSSYIKGNGLEYIIEHKQNRHIASDSEEE